MFRIACDPSSGSIELYEYLTEIIRGGSQMFVVCLVGVWQRNFEPVVCVCVCVCTVLDWIRHTSPQKARTQTICYAAASSHWLFTFVTNFKISDFNKEHMSSLKMI